MSFGFITFYGKLPRELMDIFQTFFSLSIGSNVDFFFFFLTWNRL